MAKSKISQHCLDGAAEALSLFTDSELSQYVRDVFNKSKEYTNLNSQAAIEQAQKAIQNDVLKSLYNDVKTKADNLNKVTNLGEKIKLGDLNLREILIKRAKGFANNLIIFKRQAKQIFDEISFRGLSQVDYDYLHDIKNHEEIAKSLDGKSSTEEAKRVAKAINAYLEKRTDLVVNSGALPLEFINEDRFFRNIHDTTKLVAAGRSLLDSAKSLFKKFDSSIAKPTWKAFIKPLLDLDKTFEHTDALGTDGKLNDARIDEILDDIFDNITTGKNDIFSRSKIVNGKEEILKRRRMFFKFKNWDNFNKYNKEYGTGDLFSAWQSDINGTASKVGTANLLGSNPDQAYFDLKKVQQETTPKGHLWFRNTDLYYQVARGIDQSPVSPTLANFFGNIRSLSSMAALPLVALKSTSDVAYVAAFAARWGMNYWKSYGYLLKHQFDVLKSDERQHIAKLFSGLIHSEMGFMGRFIDANNSSELMKKANMAFYRKVGLNALDTGNKVGILHLMASHLGKMSKVSFDGLNDELKAQLSKFEIGKNEWNLLRTKTEKGLFTTDNITNLSESDLRDLYEKSDKSIPLHQLRNRLHQKVFGMFEVASENAVLTPGAFEKAWLYQGHPPGTLLGELLRTFAQFKSYPLAYIDRVLVNGFSDAVGSRAKIGWALQMSLATLPLSVASNYLSYLANGQSFPDLTQISPLEVTQFGLENILGNLGVYLNITNAQNQNKGLIASQFRTPATQLISDALSIPLAIATGHPHQAAQAFKDASAHILPVKTLPILGPYMMGMLNQKPYLEPQQHIIYGYGK